MILLPRRRHRRSVFLQLACVVAACMPAAAAAAAPPATTRAELIAQIDAIVDQPRFASAVWGIAVTSLDNGRTLYAHRADHLMQPASTAKLFTAAVSLSTLGPGYRIPTRLLGRGTIRDGRLDGSLILRGWVTRPWAPPAASTGPINWPASWPHAG